MNAVRTRPFACSLLGPFFGSTRAASILPSRPPNRAAVARRACQGWPRLRGHPKGAALTGPSTAARFIGWGWRPPEFAWAPRARRPFSPPPRRQIQQRHTSANMPAGNARKIIEKFKPLILVEVHTAANIPGTITANVRVPMVNSNAPDQTNKQEQDDSADRGAQNGEHVTGPQMNA